jgi:hypothetical protein
MQADSTTRCHHQFATGAAHRKVSLSAGGAPSAFFLKPACCLKNCDRGKKSSFSTISARLRPSAMSAVRSRWNGKRTMRTPYSPDRARHPSASRQRIPCGCSACRPGCGKCSAWVTRVEDLAPEAIARPLGKIRSGARDRPKTPRKAAVAGRRRQPLDMVHAPQTGAGRGFCPRFP